MRAVYILGLMLRCCLTFVSNPWTGGNLSGSWVRSERGGVQRVAQFSFYNRSRLMLTLLSALELCIRHHHSTGCR